MSPEILQNSKKTTARKDHRCSYCLGPIAKGSKYNHTVLKYEGSVYSWRSHEYCDTIAHKLKMFDVVDDGVTQDDFSESIVEEYANIMSETQTELWESKDFKIPSFQERLTFVLNHHKIEQSQ